MPGITSNAAALAARMGRRVARLETEQHAAATAIADRLTRATREELGTDIYRIPPKRSPRTGRPLWRRTGRLFAGDRWRADGVNVAHESAAPHALARWRYGKPGGRLARPPQRASSWHRAALAKNAVWMRGRRVQALRRALAS